MSPRASLTTSLRSRAPLFLLVAFGLGCGTGLFHVDAEESQLCKTVTDVAFPGTVIPTGSQTFSQAFDYDYGGAVGSFTGKNVTTQVKLNSVTFTAKSGVSDLNFIDAANIALGGVAGADGGTLPPVTVLTYKKSADPGAVLTIPGGDFVDVTAYLADGKIHVTTSITGVMPLLNWSMDIQVCVDVKAHDSYL